MIRLFKNMITTIIFDLDGTLYSEKKFAESGFMVVSEYVFLKYGISESKTFDILKNDFTTGLQKKNFDVLLKKLSLKNENVKKLVKIYRTHYPKGISLYPDAKNFLEKHVKGFKLCLLTNGRETSQQNKISALKIKNYFKSILISTDFGDNDWKKSVSSFNYLLEKTKSKPEETIYVGDNPKRDFMGAKKLGISTIRIKRRGGDYYSVKDQKENKADYNISDLSMLFKIIKKYEKN